MVMGIDESLIAEIVRRILEVIKPDKIILFGSAVEGIMTPDSDIDLLILEKSPDPNRNIRLLVRKNLRGLGFPFDIIIMAADRFDETKEFVGGIAYPANRNGKVVYESA